MTATATETAQKPAEVAPLIGFSIIADHEDWAYLADPDASRPPTADEAAAYEARKTDLDFARAYGDPYGIIPPPAVPEPPKPSSVPHGPWPTTSAAVTVPGLPVQDEAAEDPAPVLSPIAELALERFHAEHDAQDEREATVILPAVDAEPTETVPAVADEDHGANT